MCRRGAPPVLRPPVLLAAVVTSPEATLKTVCRRDEEDCFVGSEAGWGVAVGGGGGGGTENRARSWASVSRIREVMSWLARRALVKIFGGGNLRSFVHSLVVRTFHVFNSSQLTYGRLSMPWHDMAICSKCADRSDMV